MPASCKTLAAFICRSSKARGDKGSSGASDAVRLVQLNFLDRKASGEPCQRMKLLGFAPYDYWAIYYIVRLSSELTLGRPSLGLHWSVSQESVSEMSEHEGDSSAPGTLSTGCSHKWIISGSCNRALLSLCSTDSKSLCMTINICRVLKSVLHVFVQAARLKWTCSAKASS